MALCEVALSDGSDLVAKEMEFGQGWNSPSHTVSKCSFIFFVWENLFMGTSSITGIHKHTHTHTHTHSHTHTHTHTYKHT